MVPFTLKRTGAAVLQMEVPTLEPQVHYTLHVSASDTIRDGFGLPLQASTFAFQPSVLSSFFLLPGSRGEGGPSRTGIRVSTHNTSAAHAALSAWPALLRGNDLCVGYGKKQPECWRNAQPQSVALHSFGASDVYAAIAALRNYGSSQQAALPESSRITLVTSEGVPTRVLTSKSAELGNRLLGPPGLLLQTTTGLGGGSSRYTSTISAGQLAAVTVAVPGAGPLLVWVLNATSGTPIESADVTLLATSCYRCTAGQVERVADTTTAADGLATFASSSLPKSRERPSLYVLVAFDPSHTWSQPRKELLLLENVPRPNEIQQPPLSATLLTDRGVFKLNDTICVKGYVRMQDASGHLVIPDASRLRQANALLRVRWGRSGSNTETPITINPSYGSFDASLHVPVNASYGEHQIYLVSSSRLDPSSTSRYSSSRTLINNDRGCRPAPSDGRSQRRHYK